MGLRHLWVCWEYPTPVSACSPANLQYSQTIVQTNTLVLLHVTCVYYYVKWTVSVVYVRASWVLWVVLPTATHKHTTTTNKHIYSCQAVIQYSNLIGDCLHTNNSFCCTELKIQYKNLRHAQLEEEEEGASLRHGGHIQSHTHQINQLPLTPSPLPASINFSLNLLQC